MNKINAALKPVDPVIVGPGQTTIHPRTGAIIFKAPAAATKAGAPIVLKAGEALVSPSGAILVSRKPEQKTITLSPGQKVVESKSGATIAVATDRPQTVVLGQGQSVVSTATGTTIAEIAPKPVTHILDPGQKVVDASGKTIAESPGRRKVQTLKPGEKIVDIDTGDIIAEEAAPAPESIFFNERGEIFPKVSAEIRKQVGTFVGADYDIGTGTFTGISPEQAKVGVDMAAEVEKVLRSEEVLGIANAVAIAASRIDLPENISFAQIGTQIEEISDQNASPTPGQLAHPGNYLNRAKLTAIDVGDATGVESAVINLFLNNLLGQLNPALVDVDVVKARQRLAILEGDFINAFNRNQRLPVWEQIRLTQIFKGPSALRSPEGVRAELTQINDTLTLEIDISKKMLDAPLSVEQKRALLDDIGAMAQFRSRIRAFDIRAEDARIETIDDLEGASRSAISSWFRSKTDDEIDALPDEFRQAIYDKLRGP